MTREELVELIKLKVELIAADKPNRTGRLISPRKITIHNTSNPNTGADANAHSSFVRNKGFYWIKRPNGSQRKNWVSWHYTVDDRIAIKHLPLNEQAIHAGKQANRESIAIEICMHKGINQKAADEKAAQLAALLCHDLSLQIEDVVTHQNWTGKNCPALLIGKWDDFVARVRFYFENITEVALDTIGQNIILEGFESELTSHEGMCWDGTAELAADQTPEHTFNIISNGAEIDSEKVYADISNRINDDEVLEEIRNTYEFSKKKRFWESFVAENSAALLEKVEHEEPSSYSGIMNLPPGEKTILATETIVLEHGRPSLIIKNGAYQQPKSIIWRNRLGNGIVNQNIPSVGRIELREHPSLDWVGTGWLVEGTDLLVTNRHVAEVFAYMRNSDFVFKKNYRGRKIKASIDFKEEYLIDQERYFSITDVLYMADDNEPDVAILKVRPQNIDGFPFPSGLSISQEILPDDAMVYTLGYPARDSRIKDAALMDKIFNGIYNVKRLAPGRLVKRRKPKNICFHDCSTLGGNSGSPVISLETGKVIGLHFAGTYMKYNWAVTSAYLNKIIKQYT